MTYTAAYGTAAQAMSGLGPDYGAKTGSAEVDGQKKPNGWFTAWKGDLAAAGVVQQGGHGGDTAGPIVAALLKAEASRREPGPCSAGNWDLSGQEARASPSGERVGLGSDSDATRTRLGAMSVGPLDAPRMTFSLPAALPAGVPSGLPAGRAVPDGSPSCGAPTNLRRTQAAAAIGCELSQICKLLIFAAWGSPRSRGVESVGEECRVLVLMDGASRVDVELVRRELGAEKVTRARVELVRETTGYAIGGVPPFGHRTRTRVLADRSLLDHARGVGRGRHPVHRVPHGPQDAGRACGRHAGGRARAAPVTPLVTAAVLLAAVTHASWNAIAHRITDKLVEFTLIAVGRRSGWR